jgi:hypothetical protein
MIGSIIYLIIGTQPDIAWFTSRLSQYMQESINEHAEAAKYIFCYFWQTTDDKIQYQDAGHLGLIEYLDADWGKNQND